MMKRSSGIDPRVWNERVRKGAEARVGRPALVLTVALTLTVAFSGCGGLLKRTKSSFFTLDRIPPAARTAVSGIPVAVDVVELPPGLDRREIVVHKGEEQLEIRERDQWSASLEPLVLHTLAFDLAARLPEGMVVLPGQPISGGPTRAIDLIVEKMAAGPENAVTLDARWTLRQSGQPDLTRHEEISVNISSLDSANIATGMSQAIATLADRIVAQLATR